MRGALHSLVLSVARLCSPRAFEGMIQQLCFIPSVQFTIFILDLYIRAGMKKAKITCGPPRHAARPWILVQGFLNLLSWLLWFRSDLAWMHAFKSSILATVQAQCVCLRSNCRLRLNCQFLWGNLWIASPPESVLRGQDCINFILLWRVCIYASMHSLMQISFKWSRVFKHPTETAGLTSWWMSEQFTEATK